GASVPDAVVEILGPAGFGRCLTDADGRYRFVVTKPDPPYHDVSVFARGLLQRVATRLYFPGEPSNRTDPVLGSRPADRRAPLVRVRNDGALGFDVPLQGPQEPVFFAL